MAKNRQALFIIGIVIIIVIIGIAYFVLNNTGTESDEIDVGFFVMDHMVESMENVQAELARLGYVEGENINYHTWMFEQEDLPDADTIAGLDILMALEAGDNEDEPLGVASELANDEVPIVFIADNTFPVEGGYVESLARPGKNITGVMQASADGRRFELFVEMLPEVEQILVPYNPDEPDATDAIEDIERLAESFHVELTLVPMDDMADYIDDYSGDMDAIFNLKAHDIIIELIEFSQEQDLPLSDDGTNVEILGVEDENYYLMLYFEDEDSMSIQAAGIVEQILEGSEPAEIRVENATSLLTVNLVVADRLGIEIPDSILEQANEIVRPQDNAGA